MRQDRTSRDWGRQKETEGWLVFDSLMSTSAWTISLMEGATTGHIKETEKDGSSVPREKEREKGGMTVKQKVQIHRARPADVLSQTCLETPVSVTV